MTPQALLRGAVLKRLSLWRTGNFVSPMRRRLKQLQLA
jgi:hypothetical protein